MTPQLLYKNIIQSSLPTYSPKVLRTVLDRSGETAQQIFPQKDTKKRFFGSIPNVFFTNIEKADKPSVTMQIRNAIAAFAKAINASEEHIWNINQKERISYKTKKTLSTAATNEQITKLKEALSNIIKQPLKLSYLAEGAYGKAFVLEIGGKKFVIKTFLPTDTVDYGHGGRIEPQTVQFLQNVSNSGMLARCFFGKVSPFKGDDAYLVSKFIDQKDHAGIKNYSLLKAANPIEWEDATFVPNESNLNQINGIVIDVGGAKLKEHFPNDKKTAKIIRRICQIIDNQDEKAFNEFIKNKENQQEFCDALTYLKAEAKINNLFKDAKIAKALTQIQKDMLSEIGISKDKSVPTKIADAFKVPISIFRELFGPQTNNIL